MSMTEEEIVKELATLPTEIQIQNELVLSAAELARSRERNRLAILVADRYAELRRLQAELLAHRVSTTPTRPQTTKRQIVRRLKAHDAQVLRKHHREVTGDVAFDIIEDTYQNSPHRGWQVISCLVSPAVAKRNVPQPEVLTDLIRRKLQWVRRMLEDDILLPDIELDYVEVGFKQVLYVGRYRQIPIYTGRELRKQREDAEQT